MGTDSKETVVSKQTKGESPYAQRNWQLSFLYAFIILILSFISLFVHPDKKTDKKPDAPIDCQSSTDCPEHSYCVPKSNQNLAGDHIHGVCSASAYSEEYNRYQDGGHTSDRIENGKYVRGETWKY